MNHAANDKKPLYAPLQKGRRFIIAGGGTGGHIFPAIAIANALREIDPTVAILFVGAQGKMEMEKVPQAGYEIRGLDIAGFNRSSLIKNIGLPLKLLKSFLQVRSIFKSFRPEAVIGVGGYSSFPVLRFAQSKGIPSFIHEANSFAGKSNMLLAKKASQVYVAGAGMEKFFPKEKMLVTGNPVRRSFHAKTIHKEEALAKFGLEPGKETLLVSGGSLGAQSINAAMEKDLNELLNAGIQVIWQTGKSFSRTVAEKLRNHKGLWIGEFITNMDDAYAAADMVVSRAGAMTVAELCVVKKPVIFVPFPHAAEDHQTANAKRLGDMDAALMIKDDEIKEKLSPLVIALAGNKQQQKRMQEKMAPLGITNADEVIARSVMQFLDKKMNSADNK